MNTVPPLVIDCARVMSYAFVGNIAYKVHGALIVNGKSLGQVPNLAVCIELADDAGTLLFYCDDEWNTLGVAEASSVDEAKKLAEKNYLGVNEKWIDIHTSVQTALEYYDQQSNGMKCSFCGKRPFQLGGSLLESNNVFICNECVSNFYRSLKSEQP
ncbi:MAG: ClpX C4-type zinc finger protein [Steroidobacter sp.]